MKKAFLILGFLLLAGCSTQAKDAPPLICPDTGLMADTDTIVVFPYEIEKPADADVTAEGQIRDFRGGCKVVYKGGVDFELEIDFAAKRGANGMVLTEQDFPYFIAMLAPDETVLLREAFTTKVVFDERGAGGQREKHSIHVPAAPAFAGAYKIVVGFELTREQLALNLARKKAKQ
jgi:hypothetical protein